MRHSAWTTKNPILATIAPPALTQLLAPEVHPENVEEKNYVSPHKELWMGAHGTEANELLHFSESLGRRASPTGRVLVVGDDERMRRSVGILAQIEGCEARAIEWDGRALSAATAWDPDVIVLDSKDGTSPDELKETVYACRCSDDRQTAVLVLSATELS